MPRRGTILCDTSAGPGLLVVDGQQYPFELAGIWRSDVPPRTGMVVDVELDSGGQVTLVTAVPESVLAREKADQAVAAVKERGGALAGALVTRFGRNDLIALGLLVIGWFVLTAGSFGGGLMGEIDFTFWQVLGYLNSGAESLVRRATGGGAGAGVWGVLALAAMVGPFAHHFWRDRRAHLGGALPLALMVIALIILFNQMGSVGREASEFFGADAGEMMAEARREMRSAISFGLGTWLSIPVGLYFAGTGIKRYLAGS
jgi:hypothetical protein